jgi:tripartite-type tricarboxylate transporter receptor subunit TctC
MSLFLRVASLLSILAFTALTLAASGTPACAQSPPWPTEKPLKWLIGVPPGGTADPITRAVTDELSRRIGQAIARAEIAMAPADGYTVITVAGQTLYARPVPDIGKELAPIIRLALQSMVLAGTTKFDFKYFASLMAAIKGEARGLELGNSGGAPPRSICSVRRSTSLWEPECCTCLIAEAARQSMTRSPVPCR